MQKSKVCKCCEVHIIDELDFFKSLKRDDILSERIRMRVDYLIDKLNEVRNKK
jgi:hypothetical protein